MKFDWEKIGRKEKTERKEKFQRKFEAENLEKRET